MATIDKRIGTGTGTLGQSDRPGTHLFQRTLTFTAAGDGVVGAADIIELFTVPKHTLIHCVTLESLIQEGGDATAEIGLHKDDSAASAIDIDGFFVAVDLDGTAGDSFCSMPGTLSADSTPLRVPVYSQGYYNDDSEVKVITMTSNHALDTASIKVSVLMTQF